MRKKFPWDCSYGIVLFRHERGHPEFLRCTGKKAADKAFKEYEGKVPEVLKVKLLDVSVTKEAE
jgi:hypothetical protein